MTQVNLAPWQVWWVNFNPQVGREQAKDRPAIVVGNDLACMLPNGLAIVIPTTRTDRGLPFQPQVMLAGDENPPSFAMCDQIKAIDLSRIRRAHPLGILSNKAEREAIAQSLRELITFTV